MWLAWILAWCTALVHGERFLAPKSIFSIALHRFMNHEVEEPLEVVIGDLT